MQAINAAHYPEECWGSSKTGKSVTYIHQLSEGCETDHLICNFEQLPGVFVDHVSKPKNKYQHLKVEAPSMVLLAVGHCHQMLQGSSVQVTVTQVTRP